MVEANKYAKLIKRKHTKYTSDGRPIEIYRKGKERLEVAFSHDGQVEIIATNPLPLIMAGMAAAKYAPTAIGAVKGLLGKKEEKASPNASQVAQPQVRHKSLHQQIVEAEVYGDRHFKEY